MTHHMNGIIVQVGTFATRIVLQEFKYKQNKVVNWAGYHQVPRDTILSRYFSHDNDNITIQRFCDNRHVARNFIHDTSQYLCHWRNSEFIDCTESISQELQNIVNQFHMNDSQVNKEYIAQCLFLTHTLTTTIIKYRYVWVSELLKPFFFF